jgi:hypothetical protein
MSRRIAALAIMGPSFVGNVYTQDSTTEPATVDVTFMPAGAAYFTAKGANPSFGNYRFAVTRSKDDAPEFFGRETRYAHRVYGGVTINTSR